MGTLRVTVYGEAVVSKFARKHPESRRPLQRFLEISRSAAWPHFTAVKDTFVSADYVSGRIVFDIAGNKYRVIASVDFEEQILVVDRVLTHAEYDREVI
jgi:mRNA interferase HigB